MHPLPPSTRTWAHRLRLLSFAAMALVVAAGVYATLDPTGLITSRAAALNIDTGPWDTGALTRILMVTGLWIGTALTLVLLWQLARLFEHYAADAALTFEAARTIRRIGLLLFALAGFGILGRTLAGLAITLNAPDGSRVLAIGLSSSDVGLALAGGLMALIGAVMQQAVAVARENEGFV
ncbi:MAG: DUF2975 domain-containing protein [Paracoccaceae bacterium]|nr:DUF2975 domain-containing protein [Paracoccaceae bacterium]